MSTMAIQPLGRAVRFYEAAIGKKAVMAVTGLVLFGYVVAHMAGNLQIYFGNGQINSYAAFLHNPATAPLLWGARSFLILCVALHVVAATQLWFQNRAARPIAYYKKVDAPTAYAARTMVWSGPIIGFFVIFHVLHLTVGSVVPLRDLNGMAITPDVRYNVIVGFQNYPLIAAFYIVAVGLLCLHLFHGVWSMFQSVGVSHPRYTEWLKRFAAIVALAIAVGDISIPVAALAGWLHY